MASSNKTAIPRSKTTIQLSSTNRKSLKKPVLKKAKVDEIIIALDTENAAKAIGVSAAMLKKMRAEGTGPIYSKVGTKVVYLVKKLESYLINNIANGV